MCPNVSSNRFSEESLTRLFYHSFTTSIITIIIIRKSDSDERFKFLYRIKFCHSDNQPSVPVVIMIWMDG